MYMVERQNSADVKHLRGPKLAHAVGEEWSKMTDYEKEVRIAVSLQCVSLWTDHLYSHT
jgi:hypothetical protein